jgi:protein-disulfide isomerase
MADGIAVGVTGTPAIFVNGRPLPGGAVPFEMVAELIDDELDRIDR